jgi:hypothetical protein
LGSVAPLSQRLTELAELARGVRTKAFDALTIHAGPPAFAATASQARASVLGRCTLSVRLIYFFRWTPLASTANLRSGQIERSTHGDSAGGNVSCLVPDGTLSTLRVRSRCHWLSRRHLPASLASTWLWVPMSLARPCPIHLGCCLCSRFAVWFPVGATPSQPYTSRAERPRYDERLRPARRHLGGQAFLLNVGNRPDVPSPTTSVARMPLPTPTPAHPLRFRPRRLPAGSSPHAAESSSPTVASHPASRRRS